MFTSDLRDGLAAVLLLKNRDNLRFGETFGPPMRLLSFPFSITVKVKFFTAPAARSTFHWLTFKGSGHIQDRLNATEVIISNRLTEEGKTRRDQLESNASTIKLEISKLIDKLKALETALRDQIRDQEKKQAEQIDNIHKEISSQTEKIQDGFNLIFEQFGHMREQIDLVHHQQLSQKKLTYITWGVIVFTAAAVVLLVKYF